LSIGLVDNYLFRSLDNEHCIENMPTYSIWTTSHKYEAEAIAYGSMPITYKEYTIENYWFLFSEGKVVEYGAGIGNEFFDMFFAKGDSFKRLGEIALIDFSSPISKT